MRVDFEISAGDTLAPITASLTNVDNSPVDLTEALSVSFVMRAVGSIGEPLIDAPADIIAPTTAGRVQYLWSIGDTATAGDYLSNFVVSWPDGQQSYPARDHLYVTVVPSLSTEVVETSTLPVSGWATAGDIRSVTGESGVSPILLAQAHLDVVAHSGITPDVEVSTHDRLMLTAAVCYQAIWLNGAGGDALTRSDVTSIGSGGNSAALKDDAVTLAPRARLFLSKLSFLGSASVRVGLAATEAAAEREQRLWKTWC